MHLTFDSSIYMIIDGKRYLGCLSLGNSIVSDLGINPHPIFWLDRSFRGFLTRIRTTCLYTKLYYTYQLLNKYREANIG